MGGWEGGCGGGGGSWAGIVEQSRAESEALSNVRVQGQDCRVSTCSPPGPTAQAIINPLSGATACHYSLTHTHMFAHNPMDMDVCTIHTNMNPLCSLALNIFTGQHVNTDGSRRERQQDETCFGRRSNAFILLRQ